MNSKLGESLDSTLLPNYNSTGRSPSVSMQDRVDAYNTRYDENSSEEDTTILHQSAEADVIDDNDQAYDDNDNTEGYIPIEDFGEFVGTTGNYDAEELETSGFAEYKADQENIVEDLNENTEESVSSNDGFIEMEKVTNKFRNINIIKPLSKEKVDTIRSVMAKVQLTIRPGLDRVIETIPASRLRFGDEV